MRMGLETRGIRGLVANLYARDRAAQTAIRRVVRRNGVAQHERARTLAPVDTGFLRSQLRLTFSEQGLVYAVGWRDRDFTDAGLAPYFYYTEFGTSRMAPRPCLFPARDAQAPVFRAELRDALRAAVARRQRRGR